MTHPNEAYETKIKFTDMKDFIKKDLKFDVAPANLSDTEVVDFIVYLRDLKSTVEAREKLLGEVLKTRFASGLEELKEAYEESGEKAYLGLKGDQTPGLVYEYVVQQRLDTASIEAEMGSDWMEEHKKPTTFFQARVTKG